jgi:hypothetical protein
VSADDLRDELRRAAAKNRERPDWTKSRMPTLMSGRPWTEADGIEEPPPWPVALGTCSHCGRLGSDPDGDHSCPCPHPDATCPDHPEVTL